MNIEYITSHALPAVSRRFIVSITAPLGMEQQTIYFKTSDIFAISNSKMWRGTSPAWKCQGFSEQPEVFGDLLMSQTVMIISVP